MSEDKQPCEFCMLRDTPCTCLGIDNQIRAVQRELALRNRVYPSLMARGKMNLDLARYEVKIMEAVLKTLQDVKTNGGKQP